MKITIFELNEFLHHENYLLYTITDCKRVQFLTISVHISAYLPICTSIHMFPVKDRYCFRGVYGTYFYQKHKGTDLVSRAQQGYYKWLRASKSQDMYRQNSVQIYILVRMRKPYLTPETLLYILSNQCLIDCQYSFGQFQSINYYLYNIMY